jgi:hypothetical protein
MGLVAWFGGVADRHAQPRGLSRPAGPRQAVRQQVQVVQGRAGPAPADESHAAANTPAPAPFCSSRRCRRCRLWATRIPEAAKAATPPPRGRGGWHCFGPHPHLPRKSRHRTSASRPAQLHAPPCASQQCQRLVDQPREAGSGQPASPLPPCQLRAQRTGAASRQLGHQPRAGSTAAGHLNSCCGQAPLPALASSKGRAADRAAAT